MLTCRLQLQNLFLILAEHTRGIISEYTRIMKRNARNASTGSPKEEVTATVETHLEQCAAISAAATATLASLKALESYHQRLLAAQPAAQEQHNGHSCSSTNDVVGNPTTAADRPDIQFAFCSTLAKLVQVSPVRFIPLRPFAESLTLLSKLCDEVVRVCAVSADILSANQEDSTTLTLEEVCQLSLHLSAQRPHILARGFYYAVLHTQSAQIGAMLQKSMLRRGVPNVMVASELVAQQWLPQNPHSATWETLKSFCINRNRYMLLIFCGVMYPTLCFDDAGYILVWSRC